MNSIINKRREIDRLTVKLVRLIGSRERLANQISTIKRPKGMPVLDIDRKKELMRIAKIEARRKGAVRRLVPKSYPH